MCEGCGREDFREKEYAEGLGFEVEFHPQDVRHGRTDIHGRRVPNDALRFHLKTDDGEVTIWMSGRSYPEVKIWWRAQGEQSGGYDYGRRYDTLREALDGEAARRVGVNA
jgi:hypothetical protein